VSPQDFSPASYPPYAGNGSGISFDGMLVRARPKYWLHGLLFLLTLITTTSAGTGMMLAFQRTVPFDIDYVWEMPAQIWHHPSLLMLGLPFSLTLLAILTAHEFGHYFACRYYDVDASLPYFLPSPLLMGTFGAVIRIRSAIFSKRILFDIGVAGPLAGFVFLLPALAIGVAFSSVFPGIAHQGAIQFGTPPLLWLLEKAIFPGVPVGDIYLHPVARAAWIGILATALNLLPIGQLDGGHILYALVGDRHKLISKIFIALLLPLGYFSGWWVWWLWAAVLFFLGRRHPAIYDTSDVGLGRTKLGWVALVVFLLCFTYAPISTGGL
jgi:membrane-associated protease RseP (regulator of RpoE activity)